MSGTEKKSLILFWPVRVPSLPEPDEAAKSLRRLWNRLWGWTPFWAVLFYFNLLSDGIASIERLWKRTSL